MIYQNHDVKLQDIFETELNSLYRSWIWVKTGIHIEHGTKNIPRFKGGVNYFTYVTKYPDGHIQVGALSIPTRKFKWHNLIPIGSSKSISLEELKEKHQKLLALEGYLVIFS